jgi:hypothetical protein
MTDAKNGISVGERVEKAKARACGGAAAVGVERNDD